MNIINIYIKQSFIYYIMLKKIYKNNGIIYLSNENNSDIRYNYIFVKNYNKYKDNLSMNEIKNISKKEYYNELGCSY
tara:strand:+ start:3785 stop:4015 length:231 start_codon:yes stop_codon:yes gene_type:complete